MIFNKCKQSIYIPPNSSWKWIVGSAYTRPNAANRHTIVFILTIDCSVWSSTESWNKYRRLSTWSDRWRALIGYKLVKWTNKTPPRAGQGSSQIGKSPYGQSCWRNRSESESESFAGDTSIVYHTPMCYDSQHKMRGVRKKCSPKPGWYPIYFGYVSDVWYVEDF